MSESKPPEKSPYGNYTIQEIMLVEAGNYFIQVGGDVYTYDGKMAFSRDSAEKLYDHIWKDLDAMKENGDETAQSDAHSCLLHFRIHPMRIH